MPSWVILVIGLSIVGVLVLVARKLGAASAERKLLKKNIKAAEQRKAIDNEIQKLNPDELAARLRDGL